MRSVLMDLLYQPDAAFRTYLEWEPVRRSLDRHFSGQGDAIHLVSALTAFEITVGLWVEPGRLENLELGKVNGRFVGIS